MTSSTTTDPRTEAGRQYVDDYVEGMVLQFGYEAEQDRGIVGEQIAAIEQEARSQAIAEVEEAVRGLAALRLSGERLDELAVSFGNVTNAGTFLVDFDEYAEFVDVDAVLAALQALRGGTQ